MMRSAVRFVPSFTTSRADFSTDWLVRVFLIVSVLRHFCCGLILCDGVTPLRTCRCLNQTLIGSAKLQPILSSKRHTPKSSERSASRRTLGGSAHHARLPTITGAEIMTINLQLTATPNNSPEPPPIKLPVPHSRLTDLAARLSFCR